MGQVNTKENILETANYIEIKTKLQNVIKQFNESCKDIGQLRVHYNGDIVNDNITYIYISCMYLDTSANIDQEIKELCKNTFKLLVADNKGNNILNPIIGKYISNLLSIASALCNAIPDCASIQYNLNLIVSPNDNGYPIGYNIIVYPIMK